MNSQEQKQIDMGQQRVQLRTDLLCAYHVDTAFLDEYEGQLVDQHSGDDLARARPAFIPAAVQTALNLKETA